MDLFWVCSPFFFKTLILDQGMMPLTVALEVHSCHTYLAGKS